MTAADTLLQLLTTPREPRNLPTVLLSLAGSGVRNPLRASALPFCARQWSLLHWLPRQRQPRAPANFANLAITATGSLVHALLQHWLQPVLWGNWYCPCCYLIQHRGSRWTRRQRCITNGCEHAALQYSELELTHPRLPLTGHPDGVLYLPGEATPLLLEIKTLDDAKLVELTEPLPQHLDYQASTYGYLLRRPPYSLPIREAVFIYVSRNLPFSHSIWWADAGAALVEAVYADTSAGARPLFKVFRRPLATEKIKAEFKLIRTTLRAGRRRPLLAPHWRRCADAAAASETFCPYRLLCFSSWIDATLTR